MPETSLAAEVTPIEKWLELEFGLTQSSATMPQDEATSDRGVH